LIRGDNKVYLEPNHRKNLWKFPHFFDFFLSIFSKMKFNVCSNLTTKTSIYRLDVSQLSHFFFGNFLENDQKNQISSFSWKLHKHVFSLTKSLTNVLENTWYKFEPFCKYILGGDRFWSLKLWKIVGYLAF
jgi:hypothetical protein